MRSRRLRYLLGVVGLTWLLFVLFRIVFFYIFKNTAADVSSADITRAFWMGVRFDLRLSILISLPLLILTMVPVINMGRSSRTRRRKFQNHCLSKTAQHVFLQYTTRVRLLF